MDANKPANTSRRWIAGSIVSVLIMAGGSIALFQNGAMAQMHGHGMAHHGADGTGHDEYTMPGLRGENATDRESEELAVMFRNFETMTREVTNLPNGIRTVTGSTDEDVMAALSSHVVGMIDRVNEGNDPKIFIQSPTLDLLFQRGEKIETQIEMTDAGIVVTQTSDDPEIVATLQTHAAEVTAMADRGMQAVHEMMMQRAGN